MTRALCAFWVFALGAVLQPLEAQERAVPAARAVASPEEGQRPWTQTPKRLGDHYPIDALVRLPAARIAEVEQLEALARYNLEGGRPLQVGFPRELPAPQRVVLSSELLVDTRARRHAGGMVGDLDGDRLMWAVRLDIEEAFGFRVLLSTLALPANARIWVYGADGRLRGPVGSRQRGELGIWAPTVFGDTAVLQIDVPVADLEAGARVELELSQIAEIFRLDHDGTPTFGPQLAWRSGHCMVDGMCKSSGDLSFIDDYRAAVANLIYQKGGSSFTCTGGLLNTSAGVGPYLLTANHCFSTPTSAASLDAYWDHTTTSCGGAFPSISSMESTSGSTLLASSRNTDFTLVEITAPLPDDRYHLGWTTAAQAHGTTLHRLHHPSTHPQHYSRSTVDDSGVIDCGHLGFPRPRYLYSQLVEGGQKPGSSGSVVVIDAHGGQVVGQLFGVCGANTGNACDYVNNRALDGAFLFTHYSTRSWLDPSQAAALDRAYPLTGFTLAGGQSANRSFTCVPADDGEVIAFTFRGTVSGISSNLSEASDLRIQISGPSGSGYDVGGFQNKVNDLAFQGLQSTADGAYRSSHVLIFSSNDDGTTSCAGTWGVAFTNDWSSSGSVTWSEVSIHLHRVAAAATELPGSDGSCPIDEDLVLENDTVTTTEVFEACQTITAGPGYTIAATGNVTFRAGQRIVLRSGFSVSAGGTFVAEIDPGLLP